MTYGCAVGLDQMTTRISAGGRNISVGAHPVGVSVDKIKQILETSEVRQLIEELRSQLGGQRMMLSVQRLDYTKGTLEKLQAFEQLLATHSELLGKVTLTMICVPSAPEMSVYRQLQQQIQEVVGRINGRFSNFEWMPVRFFFRPLPFHEIVAYYANADIMWITPLRDGLNLVAKEYVATQGLCGGHGVLVLSEFAGAAAELKGALLTNPHDTQDLAENCLRAIQMSQPEAEARLRELFAIISEYDVTRWGNDFLAAVEAATERNAAVQEPEAATAAATG
jgi:trehalose-6-phosphate synthase